MVENIVMAYGQRETIFMGGGAELDGWDPRQMDYEDRQFNSYNKGPGNRLANRQRSTKNGVTLYVQNLPLGIDEQGLTNMFSNVGRVLNSNVYISTRDSSQCMFGYVEMSSIREAEEGIRCMDGFCINKHCIKVQVALSQEEKEARYRKKKEDEEFLSQLNSGRRSNMGSDSDERSNRARSLQGSKPRTGRGRAELLDELTDTESAGRRPGQDKRNDGLLGNSPFESPRGVVAPGSYPYQGGRGQHVRGGYQGYPGHMPLHDYTGGHGLIPPLMGPGYGYGNINNNFAPPGRGRGFMNMNSFPGYSGRGGYSNGGNMYNGPGMGRGYGRFPYQDHIQGGGHFPDPARMFPSDRGMPYGPLAHTFPQQEMNPNYYGPGRGRGRGNSFPGPSRPGYFTDTERSVKEKPATKVDSRPCLFCKKIGTLQCRKCKMPYCSRECQQRDWEKGHKSLCLEISEMRNCSAEELDNRFEVSVNEDFFENGGTTGRKPPLRDVSDSSSEGSRRGGRGSRGRGGKTSTKTKQSKKMTPPKESPPKDRKPASGGSRSGGQTKAHPQAVGGKHGATASLPSKKTISSPQTVTRFFFKNITRTQLPVGSSVQVVVTHVENPTEIWIQKAIYEDLKKLDQLKEMMNKVCDGSTNKVATPMVGDVLAGLFEQQWYRAVVRSLKAPDNATVFYFDYGNTATVTYSKLRNVTEEMCRLPAQAVQCCLDDVRPVKEGWSQEVVAMLRSEGVCVFQVDEQKDGRYTGQMFLPDGGASVKDMLIEKGLARSKGPLMVASDLTTLSESLHVGREMTILILDWKSPVHFSAQLMEADNVDSFHSLIQDIKTACHQEGPYTSPRVGEFVIGQWTDHAWYRAEVLEADKTKVKVLYVDFGNVEDIDITCVRAGREAFARLPIQCLICQLHGVTAPESGVWPKEVNELFKNLAGTDGVRTEVRAVVKSKQDTRLAVELYDVNNKPISVAVAAKLKECSRTVPSVPKMDTLPLDGTSVQVAMTEVVSCDCFYVQSVQIDDEAAAMKLLEALGECEGSPAYTAPTKGELVAAKYSQDNDWYRSVVLSVTDSHCEVMFVDFGNKEVVPVSNIRKLDHSAMLLPQRAIRCRLAGLHKGSASQKDLLKQHTNTAVQVMALSETEGEYEVKVTLMDGQCLNDVFSAPVTSSAVYTLKDVAMTTPPGGKSPVTVACVEHPGSLYCQLVDKEAQDALAILSRNMGLFYKGQTTPAADPQLNQLFCAEVEGSWYRCVVVERRGVAVRVRLLDVGTMEELAVTDLRAMKPEFLELPVPVFKCSLHGIKPTGATWIQDAVDVLKRIERQMLLMTLKGKTDESYQIQLSDTDDEAVKVSAILVGQGLAMSAERPGQASSDPPIIAASLQKSSLPLDGTEIEAISFHIQDFDELFIQVVQGAFALRDLMLQLNVVCQSSDATLLPGKGEMVAALFEGDWYRARVDGTKETNCRIFFVDYGNYDNVPFSSIKKLDLEFCQIPIQGIHCSLAGVNIKNDKEKLKQLQEVVSGVKLVVKAISVSGNIFSVQIQAGQHNVNELFLSKPDVVPKEDILPHLTATNETSVETLQSDSVPVPTLPSASLPTDGSAVDAVATDVQDFSSIYIQTIEGFTAMQEFTGVLITQCMKDKTTITPKVGDYVCACFSEDSVWYRALVTEMSDSTCKVFFIDYGNSDTLPFSQIKKLDASLRSPPIQGMKCRLDGVDGGSPEMLEKLKQTIREVHLKVRAVGRQDDVYSVVIEVNGTNVNDMFTTDVKDQQPVKFVSLATDGTDTRAVATFVQGFDVLYIQTQDGHSVLCDLMDEMNAQCTKNPFTIKPQAGDHVCAFFSSVDEWYRARVDDVTDSQCNVFSLDFGISETVPYSSIKRLDKQFRCFPIQGIRCSLDGVPVKDDPQMLTQLQEMITNKHLDVKVINERDGVYSVEIRVDDELLNDYFRTNNGTASLESKPSLTTTPSNIQQSQTPQSLPSKTVTPETPLSGVKSPSPSPPALRAMKYTQLPLGTTVDALATDVHDFDCITIQTIQGCNDLLPVREELKVYCTNTSDSVTPAVGDTVCALFSGDKEWYRARIDEVRDNVCQVFFLDYGNSDMVKITDLRKVPDDFLTLPIQGIQCSLQTVSIRNNQAKIEELKNLISNVKLSVKALSRNGNVYNVEMLVEETSINDMFATAPSEDQDLATIELPQGTYDAIVMDIQDFDCIYFQTFEGYLEVIELMKEINVSCTNCPDSITPKVGDAVCALFLHDNTWYRARVEEETKDGRYRVFFFDHGNSDVVLPAQIKMLEKRFRSLPVKGYRCHLNDVTVRNNPVKLALLQEKISGVKLQVTVLDIVDEVYSVEIKVEGESINDLFNAPVVQAMTCQEIPIDGSSVEACVTHIEDFDAISIQTVEGAVTLEPLMKKINIRCLSNPNTITPKVGDMVCAFYNQYQSWYRARVDEVTDTDCQVFFCDYGNSDRVELQMVRELESEFVVLPQQAVMCCLEGVDVRNNREELLKLAEKVDSQKVIITASSMKDGVYKVKMCLDDGATSVNSMFQPQCPDDDDDDEEEEEAIRKQIEELQLRLASKTKKKT